MTQIAEYGSFLKKLQNDAQFAKGFLLYCYYEGYVIEDIKHPDEIEYLPNDLVIQISTALLPFYYMEKFPNPSLRMH